MAKDRLAQAPEQAARLSRSVIDYDATHAESMEEAVDLAWKFSTLSYLAARGLVGHASEVMIDSEEVELIAELTNATQQAVDHLARLHDKKAGAA